MVPRPAIRVTCNATRAKRAPQAAAARKAMNEHPDATVITIRAPTCAASRLRAKNREAGAGAQECDHLALRGTGSLRGLPSRERRRQHERGVELG